jgi:hypothetical protein
LRDLHFAICFCIEIKGYKTEKNIRKKRKLEPMKWKMHVERNGHGYFKSQRESIAKGEGGGEVGGKRRNR